MLRRLSIKTPGRGLHAITSEIESAVDEAHIREGLCTLFIRHTSASLLIQENADPSARRDLEAFFDRVAPDGDPRYTHTDEGPDDMPSHIRAALTQTSLSIPVQSGRLVLGRWQGIYLFEHRRDPHTRELVIHVLEG